jgi:nitrogen fixation protein FixH
MHDLIIILAFIGMVIAPAVVMAKAVPAERPID